MVEHALVRPPSANFADGLTTGAFGPPRLGEALAQHASYCEALERAGLNLVRLEADSRYPDSTFVEDTAVLTDRVAVLTRPGAPSRQGEVAAVADALSAFYPSFQSIRAPGTLDGGDVCQADGRFFIGISQRTNEAGAEQLAELLAARGYESTLIDIRSMRGLLHLKSGLAYLGDGRWALIPALEEHAAFAGCDLIRVEPAEAYAANCLRVNDTVLLAAGSPRIEASLERLGYSIVTLPMSEFRKMDGGLSCLSLRF